MEIINEKSKTIKKNTCICCNKMISKHEKTCKNCNTTQAGIWFLSYLCEIGIIENDDFIDLGYEGKLLKPFLGIDKGYHIYIKISETNKCDFEVEYPLRYQR